MIDGLYLGLGDSILVDEVLDFWEYEVIWYFKDVRIEGVEFLNVFDDKNCSDDGECFYGRVEYVMLKVKYIRELKGLKFLYCVFLRDR